MMGAIIEQGVHAMLDVQTLADRDCCVFAERVVRHAYRKSPPDHTWNALARIYPDLPGGRVSAGRIWGPVLAMRQLEVVTSMTIPDVPPARRIGAWHICQGWATIDHDGGVSPAEGDRGHTWLWYEAASGWGVVLDSTRDRGPKLSGYIAWAQQVSRYTRGALIGVAVGILA